MSPPGGRRAVLVVGATSGIGLASAQELAGRGDRVAVLARSQDRVSRVAQELGTNAFPVACDITDADAVDTAIARVVAEFGRLDAVISTAQVMAYGPIEDVPADVLARVVDVAVNGTASVARTVLPVFRSQGHGTLVVVNSLLAEIAVPGLGAYVSAKWGQLGLVRTLQLETRGAPGIHVCLVSPGAVDTPIYAQAAVSSGRLGHAPPPVVSPRRVARAAVRLLDRPRRHVEVGPANRLTVFGFRRLPFLYDRVVGPLTNIAVFRGPRVPDSPGNVFSPDPGAEALRGGWSVFGTRRGQSLRRTPGSPSSTASGGS